MHDLDKISQVAIVMNDSQHVLVIKNDISKLPEADLELGESPITSLFNFLEQKFRIKVSDMKAVGINLDRPGIVTLVYDCKLINSANENLSWLPIESLAQSLEPVSAKILEDYRKNNLRIKVNI